MNPSNTILFLICVMFALFAVEAAYITMKVVSNYPIGFETISPLIAGVSVFICLMLSFILIDVYSKEFDRGSGDTR